MICIGPPLFAEAGADATSFTDQVMEEITRLCRLPRNKILHSAWRKAIR